VFVIGILNALLVRVDGYCCVVLNHCESYNGAPEFCTEATGWAWGTVIKYLVSWSIKDLADNRQIMNSLVHPLLPAGAICPKNSYATKKMTKNTICFVSSAISKIFLVKIWKP
jgi:hypothetical protein